MASVVGVPLATQTRVQLPIQMKVIVCVFPGPQVRPRRLHAGLI